MTASPAQSPLIDRAVTVETPEHVAVGYPLADLGSRFAALLVDGILISLGLAALFIGVPLVVAQLGGVPGVVVGWGVAALLIAAFLLVWGYFVGFEGLRDGQTPGKRLLRIRAVHDGGYPLTLRGAAVRNILRLVDIQPFPTWLLGGLVMMIHSRTKRLGDVAAGSVVVRERTEGELPEEAVSAARPRGAPRLSADEFDALAGYIARRAMLRADARERIAAQLTARLSARVAEPVGAAGADHFLAALHADEAARRQAAGIAGQGSAQAAMLVRSQRPVWAEYRALVERARRRGLNRLPERDVSRFAALYREVAADLARARTYRGSAALLFSLERWVGAGHNLLYRPARRSWALLRAWLVAGFPALVRLRWRPIALAAALLYLPAVLAFTAVRERPERARSLVPPTLIARAEEAPSRDARGQGYVEVPEVFMPVVATGIISNNVQVTFAAFAGGILLGLGAAAILVFNGVLLGAAAALFANQGVSLYFWSFVLPHGGIELTAICIAGGAGLWLGSAIPLPGRRTRREALVLRGREAVSLLFGTVVLLCIAGTIEGFISPAPLPRAFKLIFALAVAALLALYLLAAGRDPGSPQPQP
ncbi:MAG TPA: stage II sporulation protein M [Longimicrobiales bacterium]